MEAHILVRCDRCAADLPADAQYCFRCGSSVGKVYTEEFSVSSDDLIGKVKDILHQGNVNRITVRDQQGKLLLEVPAAAGLIGAILAPWLAALGAIAALATECKISVERRE
jgi:hypothetical protein